MCFLALSDPGRCLQIVVERWADKNTDLQIVATIGSLPVVKPVNELLEPRKR